MTGALSHITVLDFTELLPGPFLTCELAQMGARVIKVERPPVGDRARVLAPAIYNGLNANKESVQIDLKSDAGKAEVARLLGQSDVLVEGYRPGAMARLGLDYPTVSAGRPDLIYLSLSGYGQTGPLAQDPGHDVNYLAEAGFLSLCGRPDGPPEHQIGLPIADLIGASTGLSALLAGLIARERSGKGRHLDISIADCVGHWLLPRRLAFAEAGLSDPAGQRRAALRLPAYGVFACADGAVSIAAMEDHFWTRLVQALGLPGADPAPTFNQRLTDTEAINATIAEALRTMTQADCVEKLRATDVPVAPVRTLAEAGESPQARARGQMPDVAGRTASPIACALNDPAMEGGE